MKKPSTVKPQRLLPARRLTEENHPRAMQSQAAATPQKPVAPPAYRPHPAPKVYQGKMAQSQSKPDLSRKQPVAPPAYRPQPTPKALQEKPNGMQARDQTVEKRFQANMCSEPISRAIQAGRTQGRPSALQPKIDGKPTARGTVVQRNQTTVMKNPKGLQGTGASGSPSIPPRRVEPRPAITPAVLAAHGSRLIQRLAQQKATQYIKLPDRHMMQSLAASLLRNHGRSAGSNRFNAVQRQIKTHVHDYLSAQLPNWRREESVVVCGFIQIYLGADIQDGGRTFDDLYQEAVQRDTSLKVKMQQINDFLTKNDDAHAIDAIFTLADKINTVLSKPKQDDIPLSQEGFRVWINESAVLKIRVKVSFQSAPLEAGSSLQRHHYRYMRTGSPKPLNSITYNSVSDGDLLNDGNYIAAHLAKLNLEIPFVPRNVKDLMAYKIKVPQSSGQYREYTFDLPDHFYPTGGSEVLVPVSHDQWQVIREISIVDGIFSTTKAGPMKGYELYNFYSEIGKQKTPIGWLTQLNDKMQEIRKNLSKVDKTMVTKVSGNPALYDKISEYLASQLYKEEEERDTKAKEKAKQTLERQSSSFSG